MVSLKTGLFNYNVFEIIKVYCKNITWIYGISLHRISIGVRQGDRILLVIFNLPIEEALISNRSTNSIEALGDAVALMDKKRKNLIQLTKVNKTEA